MKDCLTCRKSLPDSEFSPSGIWRRAHCRKCRTGLRKGEDKKYRLAHSAEIKSRQRKARYGVDCTPEQYGSLLRSQEFRCAICKTTPEQRGLAVDHDHSSGAVRGLLCVNCNLGLGNFKDSITLLIAASRYLGQTGFTLR